MGLHRTIPPQADAGGCAHHSARRWGSGPQSASALRPWQREEVLHTLVTRRVPFVAHQADRQGREGRMPQGIVRAGFPRVMGAALLAGLLSLPPSAEARDQN